MTQDNTVLMDGVEAELDRLLRANDIRLGAAQRRRLCFLVAQFGQPMVMDNHGSRCSDGGVVIVVEPPTGPGAELFYRSLHPGSAVVMPFGENPAFDFLKAKLTDFGTIGPCGAEGPHEMWWGGVNWSVLGLGRSGASPRIISCYPRDLGDQHCRRLRRVLATLGLDGDIEPIDAVLGDCLLGYEKANFIVGMRRRHPGPLLFVEADAELREPPLLPASLGCDFAVHKWNRWEMSARTLYFGATDAADALLRHWQHLASSYPAVWEGYSLDQAWSLTSSQLPLDTVWLPRSYHALAGDLRAHHRTVIAHSAPTTTADLGPDPGFAAMLRGARRASRSGARDALIVIKSPVPSGDGVTVILRDIEVSSSRAVATSIEAITRAFTADCGGFGQLELSLCRWRDDAKIAAEAAGLANHRVVEIAPWQDLPDDLFRTLARSGDAGARIVALPGRAG
jgi:hypothetical protein